MVSKKSGDRSRKAPKRSPKLLRKTVPIPKSAAVNTSPLGGRHQELLRPLRGIATYMDTESSGMEANPQGGVHPRKTDSPPPIVITTAANLNQLQKQLKSVVQEN
jgi:hypothetical protein